MKPNLRSSQPLPLPSVRPAMPVVVIRPPVVASPNAWVSRSNSPHVAPPAARAVRAAGIDAARRSSAQVDHTPSSQTA